MGLAPLDDPFGQWDRCAAVAVLTARAFDFPAELPRNVHYAGPILDDPYGRARRCRHPRALLWLSWVFRAPTSRDKPTCSAASSSPSTAWRWSPWSPRGLPSSRLRCPARHACRLYGPPRTVSCSTEQPWRSRTPATAPSSRHSPPTCPFLASPRAATKPTTWPASPRGGPVPHSGHQCPQPELPLPPARSWKIPSIGNVPLNSAQPSDPKRTRPISASGRGSVSARSYRKLT